MAEKPSLEQHGAVERIRAKWRGSEPLSMIVIEYHGDGDQAFGGQGDDRALGPDGFVITRQQRWNTKAEVFATLEDAHEAAKTVKNRREGSILGVAPSWR